MEAAEPAWRQLQRGGVASPYQSFDLLDAWQRHVGAPSGVVPFIVTAHAIDGEEPHAVIPFGRSVKWPLHLIHFLGGKHTSFNLPILSDMIAGRVSPDEIRDLLRWIAATERVDLLTLTRQPTTWRGLPNSFAALSPQPSVDQCTRLTIDRSEPDVVKSVVGSTMRARLRTKERRLQKLPGYRYAVAGTAADVDRLIEAFLRLKTEHMRSQGLPEVFAEPGVADFLREACHRGLTDGRPAIELHVLECDDEVLALFGASCDGERFSLLINTYTLSTNGKQSPGLILLQHMLQNCVDRGVRTFDLGVGQAHYKTFFCREPEPLVDAFLPLSPLGHLAANAFGAAFGAKRLIKETPVLWDAVQFVRRLRGRRGANPT